MDTKTQFSLTDAELRVLCAFFLSLPLPPLASVVGPSPIEEGQNVEAYLQQAAQGLAAKGVLSPEAEGGAQVLQDLAELLRVAAYGEKYTILSWHEREHPPRLLAFYAWGETVAAHEVTPMGEHRLWRSEEQDLGFSRVEKFLENAVQSTEGKKLLFPQQIWEHLLSARLQGQAILDVDTLADGTGTLSETLGEFAGQVLKAPWLVSVQAVYDTLRNEEEVLNFVLGQTTSWMVGIGRPDHEMPQMWAMEASQETLLRSARALFAPLFEKGMKEG